MTIEVPEDTRLDTDTPEPATLPYDDIYALLGVQPDASAMLAREMYWSRVQPLLDPARRDDPEVRSVVESLNVALTIVLDDVRRAAYDADRGITEQRRQQTRTQKRQRRVARASWLALLATGFGAAVAILATTSAWPLAVAVGAIVPALCLFASVVGRRRRPQATALSRLGLLEGATRHDVDLAYRTRAQELLLRLRTHPGVLDELNHLDQDYLAAMRAVIGLAPEPRRERQPRDTEARDRRLRAARAIATAALAGGAQAARFAGHHLARGASAGVRMARTLASRAQMPERTMLPPASRTPPETIHPSAPALATPPMPDVSRPPRPQTRGSKSVAEAVTVDLEQRLAASLKASALEVARSVPVVEPPDVAAPARSAAYLLLASSVGTRRVPIGDRPLRIGSGASCDLVLPAREEVRSEHALIWRHGDAVILHATDPDAECEVNGRASSWATLEDGDELTIGRVQLQIAVESRTD